MTIDSDTLEHSFLIESESDEGLTRLAYLSDHIFDFTTYDSEIGEFLAIKALEVCAAISSKTTFDYIKDVENYRWYIVMVNMPFFMPRLEWGTSIRGAWWDHKEQALESCGLWRDDDQVLSARFTELEWLAFIEAMQQFVQKEKAAHP